MSGILRIPNIKDYNQEIINGELILTPKSVNNNKYGSLLDDGISKEECEELYEQEIKQLIDEISRWCKYKTKSLLINTEFKNIKERYNAINIDQIDIKKELNVWNYDKINSLYNELSIFRLNCPDFKKNHMSFIEYRLKMSKKRGKK